MGPGGSGPLPSVSTSGMLLPQPVARSLCARTPTPPAVYFRGLCAGGEVWAVVRGAW